MSLKELRVSLNARGYATYAWLDGLDMNTKTCFFAMCLILGLGYCLFFTCHHFLPSLD